MSGDFQEIYEKRNKMILDARNESININGFDCDYISFVKGKDPLIMLPEVGDGFKTAKGVALPFALMYRCFANDFNSRVLRYLMWQKIGR